MAAGLQTAVPLLIRTLQRASSLYVRARYFSSARTTLSASAGAKLVCKCKAVLPTMSEVEQKFKTRDLRSLTPIQGCKYSQKFDYFPSQNCALADAVTFVAAEQLRLFPDVLQYISSQSTIFLQALHKLPENGLGDLTGDHGREIAGFIQKAHRKGCISSPGSIIDVGGQNSSTVNLVAEKMGCTDIPKLVVDINAATPALSPESANTSYYIGDAQKYFAQESAQPHSEPFFTSDPALIIINNMLNVLSPEKGWALLNSAWQRLRPGDYLAISGLVPAQLKNHGFVKGDKKDGIVAFFDKNGKFYKSALSNRFLEHLELALHQSSIVANEHFLFTIAVSTNRRMDVEGRRLLALRKSI